MSDNNLKFPIVQGETLDTLFRKEDGWTDIQTGPTVIFNHTKQEMVASLIADLIDSGLDEDAHFRSRFILSDELKSSDLREFVNDIDKLDTLISMVRDHIILTLKKVADDIDKETASQ